MQQQKQREEGEGRKQLQAPFTQLAARIYDAKVGILFALWSYM